MARRSRTIGAWLGPVPGIGGPGIGGPGIRGLGIGVLSIGVLLSAIVTLAVWPYRWASLQADAASVQAGIIFQQGTNDCGLAALAMLCHRIGVPVDMAALRRRWPVDQGGLTLFTLREAAAANGVITRGVFADPSRPLTLPTPWIAHLRSGEGHYVVVEHHDRAFVTVADPGLGRLRYDVPAFHAQWSGYALIVDRRD